MSKMFQPDGLSSGSLQHIELLKTEVIVLKYIANILFFYLCVSVCARLLKKTYMLKYTDSD
jgi:hypothetical protein